MIEIEGVTPMKDGQEITFKTTGYEVADVRNPNPAPTAGGWINGEVKDGYVPVWCQRENREPTTIMVAVENVIQVR